ncbi:MAG: hypothetical protein M3Q58_01755 [Bacteroidota bacterium]|nr:hypothetical protein [Bacteroidota bacterium]
MDVNLEIKPMKGLGDLNFGITSEEVIKRIGAPEEIEEIEPESEIRTLIWHYWSKGLSLFFDEENDLKLTSIEVDNNMTTLWGHMIFNMDEKEIIELFKSKGYKEIDIEEQEWGEKRISFDDAMVDLYYEEGELNSINYGVFINEMEIAVWPN